VYRRIARLPERNEDTIRDVAVDHLVRHQLPNRRAELGNLVTA